MPRFGLEQPATIALRGGEESGLALEGLLLPVRDEPLGGAVVAAPHPLYGGRMDNPVVTELALACHRACWRSLRFNWRGVGGSAGETSGALDRAVVDYDSALDFVADDAAGPILACGYSFGAATAVLAAGSRPAVRRLLLVAPPPSMLDAGALASFPGRIGIAVGERDEIAPPAAVEALVANLPEAELRVIEGADHFFGAKLGDLSRALGDLLGR